ncbi:MAG TPA: electron transport complex subunit RsxC [Candidatus Omnitrophota bacterium]|nr:electron transport complex subunit RsxC [Candidatus Omnitrophota bacterium]
MIKLRESKEATFHKPTKKAKLPTRVIIPLSQHFGAICEPMVKIGDQVKAGQLIGSLDKGLFSPIHASISGTVSAIQDYPHPSLGRVKAVVIDNDGADSKTEQRPRTEQEVASLSVEHLRKIIFDAGIVGLGGAAFPAHVKLSPPKKIDSFILNGAECEPYLTNDFALMKEKAREIIQGAKIVLKILGNPQGYIAIENNKPEAIKIMREAIKDTNFTLKVLNSSYPQGGEKQLTKSVLNREVPSGGLPFDIGVVVHNVGTVYAIYEAIYKSKPLYEKVVTLTGSCLSNPQNLLVRIGTTIRDLLEDCGPFKNEPAKIVFGGPMMGIAQYTLDVPVIKSTTGIIFFSKDELSNREDRVCCRCGRCVDVCPARIMPAFITMAAEQDKFTIAKDYDIMDCIECGLCSYVCPARRDLVGLIKYAKSRLKAK